MCRHVKISMTMWFTCSFYAVVYRHISLRQLKIHKTHPSAQIVTRHLCFCVYLLINMTFFFFFAVFTIFIKKIFYGNESWTSLPITVFHQNVMQILTEFRMNIQINLWNYDSSSCFIC